jgi:DNA-binding GntR family transcriptional regulator
MRKPKRSVVTDEIYEIIKEQILSHKLEPGSKINIDQLARELEVSNIPIRESLSKLVAEGLVTSVPYKGMYVMHMSLQELDEIFELRRTLELLALQKSLAVITREQLVLLLEQWRSVSLPAEQAVDDILLHVNLMNEQIHGLFLEHCRNESLKTLVENYIQRIERYLELIRPNIHRDLLLAEQEEHLGILAALVDGNHQLALEQLERHLINAHNRTRELFLEVQS